MALKDFMNNPEFDALKDIEGVDVSKLISRASGEEPNDDPPADPPAGDPPAGDPPAPPAPPKQKDGEPPAPASQDALLKEIFGERFKTFDEAKQANITGILDEVDILRREKTELEERLGQKPKTNFANDEVALFNEFVKETGIRNYGVFEKLNTADVANMNPMDALITKHILDNPSLAGKEAQVRKRFERKYNVDPDQVDEETLELNQMDVETDGNAAIKALQELKGKLKVPEVSSDDPKPKELTPEEKTALQTGWGNVGQEVGKTLNQLKVPIKNGKEPLLDYEISEAEQKEIQSFVAQYAVENQMELNEANVRTVSHMVYSQLMLNKLPDIVHSVFEKARSMTEDEVHALYTNPSPNRNNDNPPPPSGDPRSDPDKLRDDLFDAEMDQYNR